MAAQYELPAWLDKASFEDVVKLIYLQWFGSGSVPSGGSAVGTPVTNNFHAVAASGTFSIPAGAKGWTVTFLTGTGTFGGIAVAAGFSDSDAATTVNALAVATDSGSTAYVRYGS